MRIIIDIDDKLYEIINDPKKLETMYHAGRLCEAVRKGRVLPKGHGRIGDLDKLIKTIKERNEDNDGEPLNAVDVGYDLAFQHIIKESKECVIIEADKAESENP